MNINLTVNIEYNELNNYNFLLRPRSVVNSIVEFNYSTHSEVTFEAYIPNLEKIFNRYCINWPDV